jgi:hypothetical protein
MLSSRQGLLSSLHLRIFNLMPDTTLRDSGTAVELLTACFPISAYGVRIDLHVPEELIPELPSPIVPTATFGGEGPADAVLTVRANPAAMGEPLEVTDHVERTETASDLRDAAVTVESWTQLQVATLARGLIFVHAGVVVWRNRAIVLPAPTFKGKSTLVMALAGAGAEYYSDEYAIFDAQGRVHPYWRLPKLRAASGNKLATRFATGGLSGPPPKPVRVGWVLMSHYQPGAAWQPRRLTCGGTLLGLLSNTVPVRLRPEESIKCLTVAIADAQGLEGPRGEAADAARQILATL